MNAGNSPSTWMRNRGTLTSSKTKKPAIMLERAIKEETLANESEQAYFARRAQQELDLAAATTDRSIKAIHLDLAALYAAQREQAARGEPVSLKIVGSA